MDAVRAQLMDIRDLDPPGWWPPAPGWWLVLAGLLLLLVLLLGLRRHRRNRALRWRRDARRELAALRRNLDGQGAKGTAAALSELLRRIAMARYGRARCAGLAGEAWLDWLRRHDPRGFDWRAEGRLLLTLPYAPRVDDAQLQALRRMIDAAWQWTQVTPQPRPDDARV